MSKIKNVAFFGLFVIGCVGMTLQPAAASSVYTEAAQKCSHVKGKEHIKCVREVLASSGNKKMSQRLDYSYKEIKNMCSKYRTLKTRRNCISHYLADNKGKHFKPMK